MRLTDRHLAMAALAVAALALYLEWHRHSSSSMCSSTGTPIAGGTVPIAGGTVPINGFGPSYGGSPWWNAN